MNAANASSKLTQTKSRLRDVLHNPIQLRAALTGLLVVVGYAGIFMPLDGGMAETKVKLAQEQKRLNLARDNEQLRSQLAKFRPRFAEHPDPNEWVQYFLEGLRGFPVTLVTLNKEPLREVGPYKAVVLRMEFEGSFADLNALLRWLEINQRLCRVEVLKLAPHNMDKRLLVMQLIVLGVMG
jgi:hypothetical protein